MTVACYVRVSTEDQSLDRQREKTADYAQTKLGVPLGELEFYTDKSTGTDTARNGYKRLMSDCEADEVDEVVVSSVSRISRSIRDLDRTVEQLKENGVAIHFIDEGLQIDPNSEDPFQNAMLRLLGVFAQLEAEMAQQRTREGIAARRNSEGEYHHGPAPLGFNKDDGALVETVAGAQRYDRVCEILQEVEAGEVSKRQAARELNTSRKTIGRSLEDRAELYGL
jgi:DNA invertase Pin-like site-specific DNA recombinase